MRIGKYAVVAAGALVLQDVQPYALVVGRPAKVLKELDHADSSDFADPV